MAFQLPELPWAKDALAPHMSAQTIDFHYGKHHNAYVTNLNKLTDGTDYANMALEDVIKAAANKTDATPVFNNAAQVWNHTFFWNCLSPNGGGQPSGALAEKINAAFGSLDDFKDQFKQAAVGQFGSGWAWLVESNGQLEIMKTANADTPMVHGKTALFTVDVWEHAYYLDYQNRRPDFVQTVLDNLANWDFVAKRLAGEAAIAA